MKSRHSAAKRLIRTLNVVLLLGLVTACGSDVGTPIGNAHATEGLRIAAPAARIVEPKTRQVAIFAGGCFWGIEAVFERVRGVTRVESAIQAIPRRPLIMVLSVLGRRNTQNLSAFIMTRRALAIMICCTYSFLWRMIPRN